MWDQENEHAVSAENKLLAPTEVWHKTLRYLFMDNKYEGTDIDGYKK